MRAFALVTVAGCLLFAAPARAFTVASAFSHGCHEEITETALRDVRTKYTSAAPIAPSAGERALVDDLPFAVPDDMRDLAAAALLVGVRDNDWKGGAPTDVDDNAIVAANPSTQEEHCLRSADDDEPDGSGAAFARCGAYIEARANEAIDALADPSTREPVRVYLSVRGDVTASLPAGWVRIGRALHALQDSFAHAYRTADGMHPTVALNWVDLVDKRYQISRDGPSHKMDLDQCNAGDAIRTRNKSLAIQASTELLAAVLDPSLASAQKSDAVHAVVVRYLTYQPGCTLANDWCNAPETQYTHIDVCGCSTPGARAASGLGIALVALAVLALVRRRRLAGVGAVVFAFLVPSVARADDDERPQRFALAANVAASIIDPGVAGSVGLRFAPTRHLLLGLDGELNGFYGVNGSRFDLGTANIYASAILRWPIKRDFALRTTLSLGASFEIADLYGVPSGSAGFFAGLQPLGIEWRLAEHVALVLSPLGVAIPVPHLTGSPFAYPQFRTQVGLEFPF
jgi:MYXO-CTERM domain-containing protein